MRLTSEELVEVARGMKLLTRIEAKLDALLAEHEIEWDDSEPKDPTLCMGCGDMDGIAAGYNLLRKLAEFVLLWKESFQQFGLPENREGIYVRPLNDNELKVRITVGPKTVERVFVLGVMPYTTQATIKQLRVTTGAMVWTDRHRDYRNVLMTESYVVLFLHSMANDLFEEKSHEQAV